MNHLLFTIKVKLNEPSIAEAYNKTIQWIKKHRFKDEITYAKENEIIQVKYGRTGRTFYDYVEIAFRFKQEKDVNVEVSLDEKYISDADENDLRGHKYYIEKYLEFMGVIDDELLKTLYTLEDFEYNIRGTIIGLIALNTIFIIMFFLFYRVVFKYDDIPLFLLTFYMLILNVLVEFRTKAIREYFIDKKRKKNIYN